MGIQKFEEPSRRRDRQPEGLGLSPETEGRNQQQVSDLLDVVAVTDPRVFEDVGVVPDFGDDGGGVVWHFKVRSHFAAEGSGRSS